LTDELLDFSRLGDAPALALDDVDLVDTARAVAAAWPGTTVEAPDGPVAIRAERRPRTACSSIGSTPESVPDGALP
ncbi:MAG: hypothetical protein AAFR96_13120, partial [Planctomycetota bacterium]